MARAQCGYSVTNVCAVTNTCTQWCCQGEGLEMLGGSGEIPQQCLHQGTSPSWGGCSLCRSVQGSADPAMSGSRAGQEELPKERFVP